MNIKIDDRNTAQAAFFTPTSFFHKSHSLLGVEFLEGIQKECDRGNLKIVQSSSTHTAIFYKHLPWDSDYFGIPTFRIEFITSSLEKSEAIEEIESVLVKLTAVLLATHKRFYIFAELPCEAICSIQSLCISQWKMVETRLTYYQEAIGNYNYLRRFPVRYATQADISGLRSTAMKARNDFDRFHADFFFSEKVADGFLATFIENSINGFADITLVPNPDDNPPGAFLTANILPTSNALPEKRLARMILSAVDESRRGWYLKLISEMSYIFRDKGIDVAFMTTQATNRAVIRTWEKLGYSLGKTSHVFAKVVER
ncbi:hypothetical protein ACFL1J_01280 [Pseudomonadota bacterium]